MKNQEEKWLFCKHESCTFWTRKPDRLIRHEKCHVPDAKYYKCPDCTLKFYSLAKMLKHDRKCHTGIKDYECRVCEAEVTDIQVHMRVSFRGRRISTGFLTWACFQIHQSEKQFDCPSCPMQFRHKNSLVRHLCQHTGERPYHCPECNSAFVSMHRMKDHVRKSHPETCSEETRPKTPPPGRAPPPPVAPPAAPAPLTVIPVQPTIPVVSLVQGIDGQMYLISQGSNPAPQQHLLLPSSQNFVNNNLILSQPVKHQQLLNNYVNKTFSSISSPEKRRTTSSSGKEKSNSSSKLSDISSSQLSENPSTGPICNRTTDIVKRAMSESCLS